MTDKGACFLAAAVIASGIPQDPSSFRARADLVQIDVSVQRNSRTVTDLTTADFEVTDAGIPQRIERVVRETVPLDIVLLVDCSPSMVRGALAWLTRGTNDMASLRAPADRIQVVGLSTAARLVPLDSTTRCDGEGAQGTALFDAATTAMLLPMDGRKRVVIVLTDGADTTSLLPGPSRLQIADRASALLYMIVLTKDQSDRQRNTFMWTTERADPDWELRELARRTGGDLLVVPPDKDFFDAIRVALDNARLRYVLLYSPEGVPSNGWHEVQVKVKRPSQAEVRAKRGYWR